jgi:hypothetical protein
MINTPAIAQLLRPGLRAITGQYPTYPDEWTEIFKTLTSDKYQEIEVEMKYLGLAGIKPEGQPGITDSMGQRTVTSYVHKRVQIGFTITKEAMEDDLYKRDFPMQAVSLRKSLSTTKNVLGANILNNAFNANYPTGDGQPICSASHPVDGGVFANSLAVPTALSVAALQQMIILMQKMPMQSGILAQTKAQKLIIPPELQFNATVILNSTYVPLNGNNAINPINYENYIPKGYKINNFLTNPTAYFLLTDAPDGFKHYQRTPIESDTYVDYQTDNIMAKAGERYSMGITNVRAVVGSLGTAAA